MIFLSRDLFIGSTNSHGSNGFHATRVSGYIKRV